MNSLLLKGEEVRRELRNGEVERFRRASFTLKPSRLRLVRTISMGETKDKNGQTDQDIAYEESDHSKIK